MPVLRREGPYIWVTWLTKLLTCDDSCEFASWFKTQFDSKSWTRAERVGNLARWQVGHTDMLNARAREFRQQGYQVSREAQNYFTVEGRVATIAGKPDLLARQGDLVWVTDVKSGQPRTCDVVQVMVYMYLLPMVRRDLEGGNCEGSGGLREPGAGDPARGGGQRHYPGSAVAHPPVGSPGACRQGAQLVRVPVVRHQQRPLS